MMAITDTNEVWYYERQESNQQHHIQYFLTLTLVTIEQLHKFILVVHTLRLCPNLYKYLGRTTKERL